MQRYRTSEGTSDYFSENGYFQNDLRSDGLNRYIYKYIQRLSYHDLSDNLSEVSQINLTPAGLKKIICQEALRITTIRQSEILETQSLELPEITASKDIDIYEPLTPDNGEITLFYDGIGVKRQTDIRKDNSQIDKSKLPKPSETVKVNNDVAVLELPNNQFFTAIAGLPVDKKPSYSTIALIAHAIKIAYGTSQSPLKLVAIIDGATCIKKCLTEEIFKHILIILDWYHLQKKVQTLISMICYGKKEDKLKHIQAINALLWRGKVDDALRYILILDVKNKEKHEELITYLTKHSSEIIDYKLRQEAGRVIGSGRGEKANDTAIARRQKKKGMAWTDNGSRALAIISTMHV